MKFLSFLMFFGFSAAALAAAPGDLAAVRSSAIPAGTLEFFEHTEQPELTVGDRTITGIPPRAVAKILLQPAPGSNIRVELQLPDPDRWNGRFVGLGNGGAAGGINPAIFAGWIKNGYAVATTDMGTAPNDRSGIGNPEVWKDFGFRATHLMTTASKQLLQAYYGKAPAYSYFVGGSTGGQQALQEAQRYPEDYDGIVANVPAHCRTPLHAYFLWNYQIVRRTPFTREQDGNIMRAAVEYMAKYQIPQLAGRMIADPRFTMEDMEGVIELAMKKDPSLTPAHAEALRKLFSGPVNSAGERIFNGIPLGSPIRHATGHLYLFHWAFGGDKNLTEINFGADMDTYTAKLGPYLNAENPDLSEFAKRGGKLIMYSGTEDSIVPYHATLDYYERCATRAGSLEAVQKFFLFYLVPGMGHGVRDVPDPFRLVVDWREKNVFPGAINLKRKYGEEQLEIPLYPYPAQTGYSPEKGFHPVQGRRGVAPVANRFLPLPAR